MVQAARTSEQVIAEGVTFEQYMAQYAAHHTEWVEGMVIQLSPVSRKHDLLLQLFVVLLRYFLQRTHTGQLLIQPFVMKLSPDSPAREPDLQIVLNEHSGRIQDTMTAGAADVVIEIVSPESEDRDLIEKYHEYQNGGVPEYWVINSVRKQTDFYVLGEDGLYQRIELRNGIFRSVVLAGFVLDTTLLWDSDILQDDDRIRSLVDNMLKEQK